MESGSLGFIKIDGKKMWDGMSFATMLMQEIEPGACGGDFPDRQPAFSALLKFYVFSAVRNKRS